MIKAQYDSDGNIILVQTDAASATTETVVDEERSVRIVEDVSRVARVTHQSTWTVIHETEYEQRTTARSEQSLPRQFHLGAIGKTSKQVLNDAAREGKHQFQSTLDEATNGIRSLRGSLRTLPHRMRTGLRHFWRAANTPVTLPHFQKRGKKPPTKLKLFVVDTVRFGGTFATIFVVLFVGINYQSFLQIARADLAIGGDLRTQQGLEQIVLGTSEGPLPSGTISKRTEVNLLSVLPRVGPYQNRLIIPKLGKNVPIVRPSMNALMKEDWKALEADIQTALEDGVVFYPGSAEPGRAGNFFLTAHSSYYPWAKGDYKDVFARLDELVVGDTYSVYYGGDLHTYRVIGKKEVKPGNVSVLDQPSDKRLATLMTCTPVGTTLRRLIVTAEEIDPTTGIALAVGEKTTAHKPLPVARLESLPI